MRRVNFCGVRESEFEDGWCVNKCGYRCKCEMTPNQLIEERLYIYYVKNRLGTHFYPETLKKYVENSPITKFPKYVMEYVNKIE